MISVGQVVEHRLARADRGETESVARSSCCTVDGIDAARAVIRCATWILPRPRLVASDLFFPKARSRWTTARCCVSSSAAAPSTVCIPTVASRSCRENGGSPNGIAIGPDGACYVCNSGGWDFVEVMGFKITATHQSADYSGGRIERVDLATGDSAGALHASATATRSRDPTTSSSTRDGGMWFTDHGKIRERELDHGGVYYAAPDGSSIREVIYPLAITERDRPLARRQDALCRRDAHRPPVVVVGDGTG